MDRTNASSLENESGEENRPGDLPPLFPADAPSPPQNSARPEIKIDRTIAVGDETIELLPQKKWTQLDRYKWSAQGKLPGQPSGLEIGLDQVHFAGQTLSPRDAEACAKLERLLNDWLALERE